MKKPRKITHDIPENKIECCDKQGQILRLTPKIVSKLKFAILNISKRSCFKNYQENRFHLIIATEILCIIGV